MFHTMQLQSATGLPVPRRSTGPSRGLLVIDGEVAAEEKQGIDLTEGDISHLRHLRKCCDVQNIRSYHKLSASTTFQICFKHNSN